MKTFELVQGVSSKFWEISRSDTSVTVRFGRIGTNGQSQTKDFADAATAIAHETKLTAEKLKKGYVETTPVAAPQQRRALPSKAEPGSNGGKQTPDIDEETWQIPSAWKRQLFPFRADAKPVAPIAHAVDTSAWLRGRAAEAVSAILDHPESDADLVNAARLHEGTVKTRFRRAQQESNPLGAAVVANLVLTKLSYEENTKYPAIADAWVEQHGLAFAAEAAVLTAAAKVWEPQRARLAQAQLTFPRQPYVPDKRVITADPDFANFFARALLTRVRALVNGADAATYAGVERCLERQRGGSIGVRIAATFLLPDRQDWLALDLALIERIGRSNNDYAHLLTCVTSVAQVTTLMQTVTPWQIMSESSRVYAIAQLGPEAAPLLVGLLTGYGEAADKKRLLSLATAYPTDAAFQLLLDRLDDKYVQPALREMMTRYPRRAMRLLAAAAGTSAARELLRLHVISHPDLVADLESGTPAAVAAERVAAATILLPVATKGVPEILLTPPWTQRRKLAKPSVIEGIAGVHGAVLAWKPGEQKTWASTEIGGNFWRNRTWPDVVKTVTERPDWRAISVIALAPPEFAVPLLDTLRPTQSYGNDAYLTRILGVYGERAIDLILHVYRISPARLASVLMPLEGPEMAMEAANWLGKKSLRSTGLLWFRRHPESGARDLIPAALAKPGKSRTTAETALRLMDRSVVENQAAPYGSEVADAISIMLDADPLDVLPARMPRLPGWLDIAHLPQIRLHAAQLALPASATENLLQMLMICKPGEPYAGVDLAREGLDPASLAAFGWAVLEGWRSDEYYAKDSWVLGAQGLVGDDATVRQLAPLIKAWPGESAHARAVTGLDVLTAIGSDVALMQLHNISEKAQFKGLKTRAKEKIGEVAENLGLTAEQLADRLVPDFGLSDDGTLTLDYGARTFKVGFDEQLKPVVFDADGSRRKALPKPTATEDPAGYELFSGLKKDVRTIAADQIRRLERAMAGSRRWTATEFRTLFVGHPLLWHLARRLVWLEYDAKGRPRNAFRVAEDRTLADGHDDAFELADEAIVGIAHPLHLELGTWSDLFADYEILQPFPQLGRETFALTGAEKKSKMLNRLEKVRIPTGKVLGLTYKGWDRGTPRDSGVIAISLKPLPGGLFAILNLDPGILAGMAMEWNEQTIDGVWLTRQDPGYGSSQGELEFDVLDPITASELLRDLEGLRS